MFPGASRDPPEIVIRYPPMYLAQAQTINLADYILPLIPLLILAAFLVFAIRPTFQRSLKRQAEHMAFMREHSQRVETLLVKIVELLEKHDRGG
jgi:large-conductance mechanosensitive channel